MGTLAWQLEIESGGAGYTFLVPPRFEWRREPRYKEAANPRVIEEILDVWECSSALLVSNDGTTSTLTTQLTTFLAQIETRGSQPLYARLKRDPSGSNTTVRTLGTAGGYEQFRVESIRVRGDAGDRPRELQAAGWRVSIPVDITVSAIKKLPDANGIVGWRQRVSYPELAGGLKAVEWETTITTAEGTDARDKVRTFGLIDIQLYGDSYSYLTNSDDGVEVEVEDADEENSRTPTVATGRCRIRQWGVDVGTSGPGLAPSEVQLEIVTETDFDKGDVITTRTVTAQGPDAQGWCERQIPGALAISKEKRTDRQATREYEIEWVQKRRRDAEATTRGTIKIQITGGGQNPEFEPVCGGFLPVKFTSAVQPYTVTVEFRGESTVAVTAAELPLPARLDNGTGLFLDPGASFEDVAPWTEEKGTGDKTVLIYKREAKAVYRSAGKPPKDLAARALKTPVESWYL